MTIGRGLLFAIACVAGGGGLGALVCSQWPRDREPILEAPNSAPSRYRHSTVRIFEAIHNTPEFLEGLVSEGNALAALCRLKLPRSTASVQPILVHAFAGLPGDGKHCLVIWALESGPHWNRIVLLFRNDEGQLICSTYSSKITTTEPSELGHAVLPWMRVSKAEILKSAHTARVSGRVKYITEAWILADDTPCVGIPDGNVALALGYPDGTLSQFVNVSFIDASLDPDSYEGHEDWHFPEGGPPQRTRLREH